MAVAIIGIFVVVLIILSISTSSYKQEEADAIVLRVKQSQNQTVISQDEFLRQHGVVIRADYRDKYARLVVDDVHRNLYVWDHGPSLIEVPFSEVRSCEVERSAPTYETKKSGAIGRAAVGGIIAGSAGAIIGAATAKEITRQVGNDYFIITIYTSNFARPHITITTESLRFVQNVKSVVGIITSQRFR